MKKIFASVILFFCMQFSFGQAIKLWMMEMNDAQVFNINNNPLGFGIAYEKNLGSRLSVEAGLRMSFPAGSADVRDEFVFRNISTGRNYTTYFKQDATWYKFVYKSKYFVKNTVNASNYFAFVATLESQTVNYSVTDVSDTYASGYNTTQVFSKDQKISQSDLFVPIGLQLGRRGVLRNVSVDGFIGVSFLLSNYRTNKNIPKVMFDGDFIASDVIGTFGIAVNFGFSREED